MYDQAQRSIWLQSQLWPKLREAFPLLKRIPENVLITVGYPSSGARGRSEKIRPAEINTKWVGNENEQAFISIHPVYCDSPENMVKALAFQAAKYTGGARWGAQRLGFTKHDDGTITADSDAAAIIAGIIAEIGEPPAGHGEHFDVRQVERTRMRRYACPCSIIIRAGRDDLDATCNKCSNKFVLG